MRVSRQTEAGSGLTTKQSSGSGNSAVSVNGVKAVDGIPGNGRMRPVGMPVESLSRKDVDPNLTTVLVMSGAGRLRLK